MATNAPHRDTDGHNHTTLHSAENCPHAQQQGGNYQEDLYKESRSCPENHSLQGLDDVGAKPLDLPSRNSHKPVSFRKQHIIRLDAPKPCDAQHPKTPLAPPSDEFSWFETNCGWFILYREQIDTNIQIRSRQPVSNTYVLAMGDACVEFAALADAVLVANTIALAFKGSLPVCAL